jgi:hypothetical protein
VIVGKQKQLEEIWEMIQSHSKVLVLGCNTCVAVCHAGGNREAEILASLLRMLAIQKHVPLEIIHTAVARQCEHHADFQQITQELQWADCIVSTSCGAGVQFLAEIFPKVPIYPGIDTCFLGGTEEVGKWTERCQACGQCLLGLTGGICPLTRCAKRLLNGPCGGSIQGKCEINPDVSCAWQLIIDRLKHLGRLEEMYEQLPPLQDWSHDRAGGPRSVLKSKNSSNAEQGAS